MDLTKANQPRFQATDSDGKPMWQVYARILPAGLHRPSAAKVGARPRTAMPFTHREWCRVPFEARPTSSHSGICGHCHIDERPHSPALRSALHVPPDGKTVWILCFAFCKSAAYIPEAGAVCGNSARTDLRGGQGVTSVPTATQFRSK